QAMRNAEDVGTQIATNVFVLPNAPVDPTTKAQLTGFFILVANALLAGQHQLGFGWGKNKMGQLFYKSQLSSVGNEVLTGTAGTLLTSQHARIKTEIFTSTGTNAGDALWADPSFTNEQWLDNILTGTSDALFEKLKNPESSELLPERVGPGGELVAVVENRH